MTAEHNANQAGASRRRAVRIALCTIPLAILLATSAAPAQHIAMPVESAGDCSSCGRGWSFFNWFGCARACRSKECGPIRAVVNWLGLAKCQPRCKGWFCCATHVHCAEAPPRILFRNCCPKPICNPCESGAPHWGYYQTCWTPWPWPADWSHCPVPPPASQVIPPHTWAADYMAHINRIQNGMPPAANGAVRPPSPAPGMAPSPVAPTPGPEEQLPFPRKNQ